MLEARNRVGGRNFDYPIAPGKVAELGGEWAGPGQDRVLGLAKELGVATFDTYSNGNSVYYSNGQVQTYSGDIPPANPASLVEIEATILEFNQMASSVPADKPWTAPNAPELGPGDDPDVDQPEHSHSRGAKPRRACDPWRLRRGGQRDLPARPACRRSAGSAATSTR